MAGRYYLGVNDASPPQIGTVVWLEEEESHHLVRVMRLSAGEVVCLFDGKGTEYLAKITEVTKRRVFLVVESICHDKKPVKPKITVAVALPKGERQKWLVEKLAELGGSRLIPLKTQRGVAESGREVTTRLARQVLEATKQCGRTTLMTIEHEVSLSELGQLCDTTNTNSATNSSTLRLVAEPTAISLATWFPQHFTSQVSEVVIAIGPEGGFAPVETEWFDTHGWRRVALGPHILRVETAAIAACALLRILSCGASKN